MGIKTVEKKMAIGEKTKLIFVEIQMMATTINISSDQNISGEFFNRSNIE